MVSSGDGERRRRRVPRKMCDEDYDRTHPCILRYHPHLTAAGLVAGSCSNFIFTWARDGVDQMPLFGSAAGSANMQHGPDACEEHPGPKGRGHISW